MNGLQALFDEQQSAIGVPSAPAQRDSVLVAPAFPSRIRHFARALEEKQRLRAFVAGYVYRADRPFEQLCLLSDRILRTRFSNLLQKRSILGVSPLRCRRAPTAEMLHFLGSRLPLLRRLEQFRRHWWTHEAIERFAAERVLDDSTRLVVGREDASAHSFHRARQLGARTIYELPTAHYQTVRSILEREEAQFPGICLQPGVADDVGSAQAERKDAELAMADRVLVGSKFVSDSLLRAGFPAERIVVLPSACEESWLVHSQCFEARERTSAIVLHIGYLSLRKGTHRLLRAWKRLAAYRTHKLRLIGQMCLTPRFLMDYQGCYEHIPRLPREELRAHYASAAAFVLPAAAEGIAAVILEALSYGCPIVASRNSGAEGLLEHGKQGLLHDFGNDDELCSHLDWILTHPRERSEMAKHARERAAAWTWTDYRRRVSEIADAL